MNRSDVKMPKRLFEEHKTFSITYGMAEILLRKKLGDPELYVAYDEEDGEPYAYSTMLEKRIPWSVGSSIYEMHPTDMLTHILEALENEVGIDRSDYMVECDFDVPDDNLFFFVSEIRLLLTEC